MIKKMGFQGLLALVSLVAIGASASASQIRMLECASENANIEKFEATLDYSAYDANSGFFRVTKASYYDNYITMKTTCRGYSLDNLDCVGFPFESPGYIADVTFKKRDGIYYAQLKALKGPDLQMHNGPWACKIK